MYRFEFAKEDFKKSICRQVDDLFASFLSELRSTSMKSNNSSPAGGSQNSKIAKAISSGAGPSGYLPKTPVLSSILVSSPSSNGQAKGTSKVFQNNSRASLLSSKDVKPNVSILGNRQNFNQQQQHLQQQYRQQMQQQQYGRDDDDDDYDEEGDDDYQTNNYMKNEYYGDETMIPEVIIKEGDDEDMDEEDDDQMIQLELQQNPQQQQNQQQQQQQQLHPNNCHCPDCVINDNYEDNEDEEEEAEDLQEMNSQQNMRQQQQNQSQSNSKSAGGNSQQTRLSQRINALGHTRRSSSASSSSRVSPIKANGSRPILRGSAARRIVPPPQPDTASPRRAALSSNRWLTSSGKARPHVCRWCHKNFPSKQRLTMHEVGVVRCPECKQKFNLNFTIIFAAHSPGSSSVLM